MANIAKVKKWDIANGRGIRTSIFFSGCDFHCPGCFNSEIWDFDIGEQFTREFYESVIKPTINEHVSGISLLGGEPLHPKNIRATRQLCEWFKQDFPEKSIWLWTGYSFEEVVTLKPYNGNTAMDMNVLLDLVDVIIDGQFIESEKDLTLHWRGSRNQRVIDLQKSLAKHEIVLYLD